MRGVIASKNYSSYSVMLDFFFKKKGKEDSRLIKAF